MRKTQKAGMILLGICLILSGCDSVTPVREEKKDGIKIGVSMYDGNDTFISEIVSHLQSHMEEKSKETGVPISVEIQSAENSQFLQNDQVDEFIREGCDIMCINLVDRTDASAIVESAKESDVPVIFFNRELVKEELERWDKLYYVGAQAIDSGKIQGDILADECDKNFSKIDRNGDGILQYVILEGEAGHQDSLVRSMSVINEITDRGYTAEKLAGGIANWRRNQAASKMKEFIEEFGTEIEVVFANNDDMALGAADALEAAGMSQESREWPQILGIDGTDVGLEGVKSKKLLGTVLNDTSEQAKGILELVYSICTDTDLPGEYQLIDGKYMRLPYKAVTLANVSG